MWAGSYGSPRSGMRRPFSPEDRYAGESHYNPYNPSSRRREASDASVEALDLADYARTLRPQQHEMYNQANPYPPFSPVSGPPPSLLLSRGDTLSTSAHSHSSSPRTPRRSNHRPQSLPVSYRTHNYPYLHDPALSDPLPPAESRQDMDISHFPAFSRSWYNNNNVLHSPPLDDIYTPLAQASVFLRLIKAKPLWPQLPSRLPSNEPYWGPGSSHGHDSAMLPWSSEPPDYGPPIDPYLKEERMRMLEREFGPNAKSSSKVAQDDFTDENGKPLVGTVDDNGAMVTNGPKKRTTVRMFEILLAGVAAIPAIYAALVIKANPPPPPAGKPPAFVLYIFSVLTLFLTLWFFLFRPCCCGKRGKKHKERMQNPLGNGMMVLPVQGLPGGKKGKKPKKGKKGKHGMPPPGDVQVNLIVDPTAFGNNRREEEEYSDQEYFSDNGSMPGAFSSSSRSGGGRRNPQQQRRSRPPKRRSVFAGLAMEEAWKAARARMKKVLVFDILGIILWGAVFVFLMIGKRCPSGEFEGWYVMRAISPVSFYTQ
ncbi:hypothetical protein DL96DRAFT_1605164 [Flagelloscypha sp. PMI_526]|nr:hypothetical protein DL96DRAFT_1605164 [Flagelloscypha sp. PMI_526]